MIKEIVVAAYDKDLSWMDTLNPDVKRTVYRKGNKTDNENEIFIEPNMGRCVHTFFNHLYKNYNNLSDLTFFVQDYPFDHWENLIDVINGGINECENHGALKINGYYGFHWNSIILPSNRIGGQMHTMYPSNHHDSGSIISCSSNGYPHDRNPAINVDKYWDILFEGPRPHMYEFMPGGHFGITKEHAKLRSKELYGKVAELLQEDINAPWMIERLECYIFNPKYKTKL